VNERQRLEAERDAAQEEIDQAYWTYTRCARGKPPCLVVPGAYTRRNEARRKLRELKDRPCPTTP
jgi:hypothetical protein